MTYSVIVPVYNAEKYLKQCIESICCDSGDFELILIDDGSTDSSVEICDDFSQKEAYIHTYHIKNRGAAAARNFGLSKANGDYIVFVDADDSLSEGFFENLTPYLKKNSCDLIFFDADRVYESGLVKPMGQGLCPDKINKRTREEVLSHMAECNKFPASPWGKIVSRKMLVEKDILFIEGKVNEDVDWFIQVLLSSETFGFFEGGKYLYCYNPDSVSNNISKKKKNVEDLIYIIKLWCERSQDHKYSEHIGNFLAYEYAMIFPYLGALPAEEREFFLQDMIDLKFLLKKSKTLKLKLVKAAIEILGINNAATLLFKFVEYRDHR